MSAYLVRQPFKTHGRSVSLLLTSKGKKALARDPFEVLVRAVEARHKITKGQIPIVDVLAQRFQ